MTSGEFNEWSAHLHAHEAHRPTRPIEMACAPTDDDEPADLAWLGMRIMLGVGVAMAALFGLLLLWWVA